jgi:hypothetical protein
MLARFEGVVSGAGEFGGTQIAVRALPTGYIFGGNDASRAALVPWHSDTGDYSALCVSRSVAAGGRVGAGANYEAKSEHAGSSSFLKKRTKRLFLCRLTRSARPQRIGGSKSFFGAFFQKRTASFVAFTTYRRTLSPHH